MSEKFESQKLFTHPEEKTSPKEARIHGLTLFSFYFRDSWIRIYGTHPVTSHLTIGKKIQHRFHFIPIIIVHHRMSKKCAKVEKEMQKLKFT